MPSIKPGIYLETKKSEVGTGVTSSTLTFRNYYAARPSGDRVELFLLDDDLNLTGLHDWADPEEMESRFTHQPEHDERFDQLMGYVGAPAVEPAPQASPPQARPEAPPPAERSAAEPPQTRPAPPPPADYNDKGWWEQTSKAARGLVRGKKQKGN